MSAGRRRLVHVFRIRSLLEPRHDSHRSGLTFAVTKIVR